MKGACAALFAVLVENVKVPGQVRERTGPALIHNQLVDRSLQTNVCDESCVLLNSNCPGFSRRSFPRDRLSLQFRILATKIRHRPPLLNAVVRHTQLECLDLGLALVRQLPAQFWRASVRAWLGQKETGS